MTCNLTRSCLPEFPESLDGERNYEERYYLLFSEYGRIDPMLMVCTRKGSGESFWQEKQMYVTKNFLDRIFVLC